MVVDYQRLCWIQMYFFFSLPIVQYSTVQYRVILEKNPSIPHRKNNLRYRTIVSETKNLLKVPQCFIDTLLTYTNRSRYTINTTN